MTYLDDVAKKLLDIYPKFDDGRVNFVDQRIRYILNCIVVCNNQILVARRGANVAAYPNTLNGISGYIDQPKKSIEDLALIELREEAGAPTGCELKVGDMLTYVDDEIGIEWRIYPIF